MNINSILNSLSVNDDFKLRQLVDSCLQIILILEEDKLKEINEDNLTKILNSIVRPETPIKQKFFSLLSYKCLEEVADLYFGYETDNLEQQLKTLYNPLINPNNPLCLTTEATHLGLATKLYAISNNYINVVDFLLNKGAKVRHEGSNALLYASKHDCESLVDKYLLLGANPLNSRGDIISHAIKNGNFNILEKFRINQKKESVEHFIFELKENIQYSLTKNNLIRTKQMQQFLEDEKNPKIYLNALLSQTSQAEKFNTQKEKHLLEKVLTLKQNIPTKKMKI